jgi:SAM-dependent methyltransferase
LPNVDNKEDSKEKIGGERLFDSQKSRLYRILISVYTYFVYVFFEKPKGIDFIRTDESPLKASASASYYISVPVRTMEKILHKMRVGADDSFLDIGCGKGFILYLAQKSGFGRVHGIDLSPGLCRIANENLKILKASGRATVECIDAAEYKNFDGYSFIFMNNPFSADIMEAVVHNIELSLMRRPRNLTVIYLNPHCHRVLDGSVFFKLTEKRSVSVYNPLTKWSVYYYRSIF